ncbi:hypothetical protein BDV25DRAFT_170006 [Aspergillus avenaceus]|uniref:DUF4139 domain-containing protein n=1 Tax=Aspergillus avenaceus TaxID=36643 RepID=A0A5N6U2V4_ASPAV|nr:hypothetical protein BDV25DRAFT_170006 [Aspergillus avenaceus]
MTDVHQSEIQITHLPTNSVVLSRQKATVTREIQITVQPGQNEIIISGLDPNVDLDSIQIEGYGPVTITDLQTEIVPRREKFDDVYPDLKVDEESDSDIDGAEDEEAIGVDDSELQAVLQEEQGLTTALAKAQDDKSASLFAVQFLVNYGKSMDSTNADPSKLNDFLKMYLEQRKTEGDRARDTEVKIVERERALAKLKRKRERLESLRTRAQESARKDARRLREDRTRERQERRAQQLRDRQEKQRFWTERVGQVRVYIDGQGSGTQNTSRRSSIFEEIAYGEKGIPISMNLNYIIPGPSWVPRYDLKINTPASIVTLIYKADVQNSCSETWKDAKISLSTSDTTFSGLNEPIPILKPWHITTRAAPDANPPPWESVLRSSAEVEASLGPRKMAMSHSRADSRTQAQDRLMANARSMQQARASTQQAQAQQIMVQQAMVQQAMAQQSPIQASFMAQDGHATPSSNTWTSSARRVFGWANETDSENEDHDDNEDSPSSGFEGQGSVRQDYGLTTTHELSGRRTLTPSTSHHRYHLTQSILRSLILTHVIVPKIRPVAFLRARVRNTSSVNILRAKTGITVDGTFIGTSTLSRCAPDDFFNISLGMDPNILVIYAKPTVRKLTSGFFHKENAAVFHRSCWIKNTKGSAIDMIVSDQIPLEDNENMRVQMLEPKGLEKEGDEKDMVMEKDKGRGKIVLMRNGEVKWFIKLEPGKDVRMVLEYQTRVPVGNTVNPV